MNRGNNVVLESFACICEVKNRLTAWTYDFCQQWLMRHDCEIGSIEDK